MERKDRSTVVSIRIPEGLVKRIENDVETNGDHASRADWIIAAIREYEKQRTELIAQRKLTENADPEDGTSLGFADKGAYAESHANHR